MMDDGSSANFGVPNSFFNPTTMRSLPVSWSQSEFSLKQLIQLIHTTHSQKAWDAANFASEYGTNLLCRVEEGFQGRESDLLHEFGADEVFWIRGIDCQKRLVVKDTSDRYLSIPFCYGRCFNASYDGINFQSSPQSLLALKSDITSGRVNRLQIQNDEPVMVNVGPLGPSGLSQRLGPLEIVDCYNEKYLIAHSISEDYIYCDTVSIPAYMPITFSLAEGFDPSAKVSSDFGQWIEDIKRCVSAFSRKKIEMCQEIVCFETKPSSDYEYVTPTAFIIQRQLNSTESNKHSRAKEDIDDIKYLEFVKPQMKRDCGNRRRLPRLSFSRTTGKKESIHSLIGYSEDCSDDGRPPCPKRCVPRTPNMQDRRLPPPPPTETAAVNFEHENQTVEQISSYHPTDDNPPPLPLRQPTGRKPASSGKNGDEHVDDLPPCRPPRTISIPQQSPICRPLPKEPRVPASYEQIALNDMDEKTMRVYQSLNKEGNDYVSVIKVNDRWSTLSTDELIMVFERLGLHQYVSQMALLKWSGKQLVEMSQKQFVEELGLTDEHATVLKFLIEQNVAPL